MLPCAREPRTMIILKFLKGKKYRNDPVTSIMVFMLIHPKNNQGERLECKKPKKAHNSTLWCEINSQVVVRVWRNNFEHN